MTVKKDVQVARKRGREGEVIRAMPERKHFFREVFRNTNKPTIITYMHSTDAPGHPCTITELTMIARVDIQIGLACAHD